MASTISLCVDGCTDVGNRRPNNEDAWWAGQAGGRHASMVPGPQPLTLSADQGPSLLIVSDGIGGSNAGEVASQMAVNLVSAELLREPGALGDARTAGFRIRACMEAADLAIKAAATEPGFDGMGATLSLLCISGTGLASWGHAGDSRIYVCRSGKLRQVSRDHSAVGKLRQRGEITEAEARRHSLRNQIDQSLGNTESPFEPDVGSEAAMHGDVFLLCSDGLSDGLWDHEIESILAGIRSQGDVRPAVVRLVQSAKEASGRDNITVVVARAQDKADPGPGAQAGSYWRRTLRRLSKLALPPAGGQAGGTSMPQP